VRISRGNRWAASCSLTAYSRTVQGEGTDRPLGISENIYDRWRKRHGSTDVSGGRRLRELEAENARLKRLPAERDLEIDAIREVLRIV